MKIVTTGCMLALSGAQHSFAAVGFNGAIISPFNQFVCTGNSATLTLTPGTCPLAAGPDWSAVYHVDSSFDGGTSWFTPSGISSGICSAAAPIITYTTSVFTSAIPYYFYYRIRLTGIIANCTGGGVYTSSIATIYAGAAPTPITGAGTICLGSTAALSDAIAGGSWTSSAPSIAPVTSGIVTGSATGTAAISYSFPGGCAAYRIVTVSATSTISGDDHLCPGNTSSYTSTGTGTTWTSSNTAVATINPVTGLLSAISAGTTTISYGLCSSGLVVSVNPAPIPVTGLSQVCVGGSTVLIDISAGGIWSSSAPGIGSISPFGVLTGMSAGLATISYTLPWGCYAILSTTVNPLPSISGSSDLCLGTGTSYSGSLSPGAWASSIPGVGTISATTGAFTAIASGVTTISYTLLTGCFATFPVTVSPLPAAISGVTAICEGTTTILADITSSGTWSSSDLSVATIGSVTGAVSAGIAGTTTISYIIGAACVASAVLTVNPIPGPITGTLFVCQGATTALSCSPAGGTWTSGWAAASVGLTSGIVTGLTGGTAEIIYMSPLFFCATSAIVTVNPLPDAGTISGATVFCSGATETLTETVSGGIWSSSAAAIADISAAGTVTAVVPGTAIISYTVAADCGSVPVLVYATKIVTVEPNTIDPGIITGLDHVCQAATTTLTNTVVGGTWVSADPAIATVSSTGVVTGVSPGAVSIRYFVANTCTADSATQLMNVTSCIDFVTEQPLGESVVNIFPNPSDGNFIVDLPGFKGGIVITIYDLLGKAVADRKVNSRYMPVSFQLQGILPGSYIVRIATDNAVYRRQLTIR